MTAFRVLVTGSRNWAWPSVIWETLDALRAEFGPALVVVHGACPRGADAFADAWARRMCVAVERFPAQWTLGRRAGFIRNAAMVESRPDRCIAFIRDASRGASHCAGLAEAAGILTLRWTS